jgi:hypothetical protein
MTAACVCGRVEVEAIGAPIACGVCYCDDCQEGARRIEALPGAHAVAEADGRTSCILYRKDRIKCSKGVSLLKNHKITDNSVTNRVVAICCSSAMFMNFDDTRHWVAAYRSRFHGDIPPVQMRICTRYKSEAVALPNDVPSYPGYRMKFMAKLLGAWVAMRLRR